MRVEVKDFEREMVRSMAAWMIVRGEEGRGLMGKGIKKKEEKKRRGQG